LGVVGLSGCGDSRSGSGQIQLRWSLVDNATRQPLACSAGEVVRVTAGAVADVFNCGDMAGITEPIRAADYDVRVDLVDAAMRVESTITLPRVSIFGGRVTDVGVVVFPVVAQATGSASFTWELRLQATGQPATCAAGETVQIAFGGLSPFNFNCSAMAATINSLPAGSYQVTGALYSGSTVLSMTPAVTVVVPPNGAAPTQPFVFLVTM
jgi:hypothetical protein